MTTTSPNARRALAAALLVLPSSVALADLEAFVASGDRISGDLAAGGETETLRFACADGDTATVTIRAAVPQGADVRILDDADGVLAQGTGKVVRLSTPALAAGEVRVEIRTHQPARAARYEALVTCGPVAPGGPRRFSIASDRIGPGTTRVEADLIARPGGRLAAERWPDAAGAAVDVGPGVFRRAVACAVGAAPDLAPPSADLAAAGPAISVGPASQRFPAGAAVDVTLPYRPAEVTRPLGVLVSGVAGRIETVAGATADAEAGVVRFRTTRFGIFQVFQGDISIGPVQAGRLTAADAQAQDALGPVASDALRLVAGAETRAVTVGSGSRTTGAAFVFDKVGGGWQQIAKLVPSDRTDRGRFGHAVAVDGDVIVVGAPQVAITESSYSTRVGPGAAYVFERVAGTWSEAAILAAPPGANAFGADVAVSGRRIVVGSPAYGSDWSGAAFVYERTDGVWTNVATLRSPNPSGNALLGEAVAIDGTTVVAGAKNDRPFGLTGGAYVFVRAANGTWPLEQQVAPAGAVLFEGFGNDVAVQGDRLAVAASRRSASGSPSRGAVYVFDRTGGTWSEKARIDGPANAGDVGFGLSIGLDGDRVLIGAAGSGLVAPLGGAVYLAKKGNGDWTSIVPVVRTGTVSGEGFGRYVTLRGTRATVAAPWSSLAAPGAGAVFVVDVAGK